MFHKKVSPCIALVVYSVCFIENRMKNHTKCRLKISLNRKCFMKSLTKNHIKNPLTNLSVYNEY